MNGPSDEDRRAIMSLVSAMPTDGSDEERGELLGAAVGTSGSDEEREEFFGSDMETDAPDQQREELLGDALHDIDQMLRVDLEDRRWTDVSSEDEAMDLLGAVEAWAALMWTRSGGPMLLAARDT